MRASRFEGTIGRTLADSEPWFDEAPHPGEDAPNVLIVLLDDTGFSHFGCYGSDIDTPNIDALAANGLQFTDFHVSPLCSPTRAALLTGRAPHAVGMRAIANFRTGFPHMLGHISNHAATLAEVLSDEGYSTFCTGKWHLAPMEQASAAGPFDQWPLARGFDRYYGFLDGETDQFYPDLVCDNHHVEAPGTPADGYHVSEDIVDRMLRMVNDSKGLRPDRPFFGYVAFGATHAPHQAPPEYLEKYRGKFDEGWDVTRERWHARQMELGLLPEGTALAPRNPGVDAWDEMPENQRRLAARLQEAFAAMLDHTDAQIGRLVDGLAKLGELDNTIVMVLSDNGASQEGGPYGVMHEMKFFNFILETPDEAIDRIDDIGGPRSHTNYPWGWAQAGNTPFKWYKQNTHEGGVHVPLVMHWPTGIAGEERGSRRDQFAFVSDIAPTIYELVGVTPPAVYNGLEQMPVTGKSFASVVRDRNAPAANTVQHFEMLGSRGIIADGWKAVVRHERGNDFETEPWELYHLAEDRSECNNLAASDPDRLKSLVDLWWSEADRHGVLPLDERTIELFGVRFRDRSPHPKSRRYVYRPPMSPMPAQASAMVGGRDFDLSAMVTRAAGDEGVVYATGTENSGVAMFVQNDKLVFDYNAFCDHVIVESTVPVPTGDVELVAKVRRGEGSTGSVEIEVNGQPAGSADLPLLMGIISSVGSSIGYDAGSAVSDRYDGPFPFSGVLHEVVVQASPRRAASADAADHAAEMGRQ